MIRHLRIYDHFTIPHLSNTATAWRMPPQHPPGSEGSRRDGCGTRGQNRCPGAAAGPGRASRSITPSRRLACGDLAGGPPPTGTWTIGSAAVTREALHPLGGNAPNQKGYSPTPGSPQCAQARYVEPGPSHPHVGLLFRVWATPPTCGTGGPRAGRVGVQVVVARGQSAFVLVVDGCTTPSVGIVPLLIGCVAP